MDNDVIERTFAFADLSGFTLLTETHGDVDAAVIATRLIAMTEESLGPDVELVKSVGDAVMLAGPSPRPVLETVLALAARSARAEEFLAVRAGLHHGTAVRRGQDYFGSGVNVAARVAGLAAGGQAVMSRAVAEVARADGHAVMALGEQRLRNVPEAVEVFVLPFADGNRVVDPVCRMLVDPGSAAGQLRYGGRDYWFCSLDCAGRFAADPQGFTA